MYNPPQHARKQTSAAYVLRTLDLPHDGPIILAGDWNLHHPYWSVDNKPPHGVCSEVVEWLDGNGFLMHNQKGEITHIWKTGNSVLDLTFSNAAARKVDLVKDWRLDVPLSGASDHIGAAWVVDDDIQEIVNLCGQKHNVKDIVEEEWQAAFVQYLHAKPCPEIEALLQRDTVLTKHNIDRAAETLVEAMCTAILETADTWRPSTKTKPWYDAELKTAAARITDAKVDEHSLRMLGIHDQAAHTRICKAKNFFKKLAKYKRTQWANKMLEEASGHDIFGFRD